MGVNPFPFHSKSFQSKQSHPKPGADDYHLRSIQSPGIIKLKTPSLGEVH